jgi:hypothetical protein
MKKQFFILIAVSAALLWGSAAHAQLNESDTLRRQFRASLSGNYQSGNVEIFTLRSKFDAVLRLTDAWVFKSQNSSLYQSFFSKKADNDLFSRNYLYFKPQNRLYPYAIAYLSTNYRRKVDTRVFAGAGLSYQLLRKTHSVIKLSANVVYEQSDFAATSYNDGFYNGSDRIQLWRATTFLMGSSWLFQRRMRIFYDAYWQPAFGRSSNYRTQLDAGLDVPLWNGFSLSALYTYTHENVVPLGTRPTDRILTFGLSYSRKSNQSGRKKG